MAERQSRLSLAGKHKPGLVWPAVSTAGSSATRTALTGSTTQRKWPRAAPRSRLESSSCGT